jgi:hypothetical protein
MATRLAARIDDLHTTVEQQRQLLHAQAVHIEKQQAALDLQFTRIADIQAELDLVKATVRNAAPAFAAALIGPQPAKADAARTRAWPSATVPGANSRFARAFAASSLAHEMPSKSAEASGNVATFAPGGAATTR